MAVLWIDADACPVKAEALRVGLRHGARVVLVSNGGLRPSAFPGAEVVVVPEGPDMADKWIAERVTPGDVCITTDLPLAARVIEGGGRVVKPNGETLTARNIGPALASRDLAADLRAADPFRQGGGRAFSQADRSRFLDALDRMMRAT
jgi:uncharacterized protein YaiI (UPF0178 family)